MHTKSQITRWDVRGSRLFKEYVALHAPRKKARGSRARSKAAPLQSPNGERQTLNAKRRPPNGQPEGAFYD
jgi:hypothetical protein